MVRSGSSRGAVSAAAGAPGAVAIVAAVTAGLVVGAGGLMAVLWCRERGSKAVAGVWWYTVYCCRLNSYDPPHGTFFGIRGGWSIWCIHMTPIVTPDMLDMYVGTSLVVRTLSSGSG